MIIGCIVIYTPLILWYFLCCHKLWINVVEDPGVDPASAFVAYYYSLYYHCSWFKVHLYRTSFEILNEWSSLA